MKKILFLIVFMFTMFTTINYTYAGFINSSISLSGITNPSSTWTGSNAGKIVFPNTASGVKVNASGLNTSSSSDITISGNFWLSETSSSSSGSLGWADFDTGLSNKVILKNNGSNTFTFSGFAWSNAAGWIYFSPTNLVSGNDTTRVVYNRSTDTVSGCAWSENLGWICINNFNLDTTPINLTSTLLKNREAKHNESINLNPEKVSKIEITTYTGSTKVYNNSNNITHDMRKSGEYSIKVTDNNGSYSTGTIKIVAGAPTIFIDSTNKIPGETASAFSNTANTSKVANNTDFHTIDFKLRDKYGNPVKSETGIKTVKVTLTFSNNVDKNQISNPNTGDAITYIWSTGLNKSLNTFTGSTTNGDYKIDIKSLAPTTAGYTGTTANNDIYISSLNVEVKAEGSNTGVGARADGTLFTTTNEKLKFKPAVYVSDLTNSSDADKSKWKILRDVPTTFTGIITLDNPKNISDINVTHILNTINGGSNSDDTIRFKVDNSSTNGTNNISKGDTSAGTSIKNKYAGPYTLSTVTNNNKDTFTVTPKIISAGVPNFGLKYSSNVSYTVNVSGVNSTISYPTYSYSPGSNNLVNNQLKVAGTVNNASTQTNSAVIAADTTSYIGKVDKPTVIANIKKNIAQYQRIGKGTDGVLYITGGTRTLSTLTLTNINTIIVDGGDLVINQDINSSSSIKAIIALKGNSTDKGNIWITKDVKIIYATLVTDRSVLSGNGTISYSPNVAQDQLFIKGSVLSYNTIGGSSSATPKCPFYITSCNQTEALKYDFNNFRYYIKGDVTPGSGQGSASPGISISYANSPMIVEYDSTLQTNPPKVFLNN